MGKEKVARALLMNDLHVSKDDISEFNKNWDEALAICDRYGIDELVIGGDLWQSRASQTLDTLICVRDALLRATAGHNLFVTIAEGNHCKVDQESVIGYSHIFSHINGVHVIDESVAIDIDDDVALCVMSYFPENGSFMERYNRMLTECREDGKKGILYLHEGINGALAAASDKELPADMFKEFDSVLVGHYHDRCKIEGTNVEYIGASRQHNFGEDEEKGYTILYSDGSNRFIKNQVNRRYKTITVDPSDVNDELVKRINRMSEEGFYRIKVKVNCSTEEVSTIDRQKLLDAGVMKVEINTDTDELSVGSSGLDRKFDKDGIKREYVDFCSGKGIGDMEMGLNYLDRINQ